MRRLRPIALVVAGWVGLSSGCEEPAPAFTQGQELGDQVVSAEVLNRGARAYALRCASCHGSDGSGNGPASRGLRQPPRDFREGHFVYKSTPGDALPTDSDLANVIRHGKIETGMPGWPGLSDEDMHALVQFLKTFSPRWKEERSPS